LPARDFSFVATPSLPLVNGCSDTKWMFR
jgi:hypothetical protein